MGELQHTKIPARIRRAANYVARFLFYGLLAGIVTFSGLMLWAQQPASRDPAAPAVYVEIPSGAGAALIAQQLESAGIVRDQQLFRLLLWVRGAETSLRAGRYQLQPSQHPMEIITVLEEGRSVAEQVVIPEGYSIEDIAARLAALGLVDKQRFIQVARDGALAYGGEVPFDLPVATLEGYLFPDTYQFHKGQSEESIVRQMTQRFRQVVERYVEPYLDTTALHLHEVITLASIVEKEIRYDFERRKVAGVYLNRLDIDMPLQADPTVRYVMEEDRTRVLYRDLEIESPYNTYRNRGLPPGPIASPGLASILAVLNPADVDYFFFVARGDGTHQFSRTFEEHVRARRELGY